MAKLPRNVQAQLEAADALLQQANPPAQPPQEPAQPAPADVDPPQETVEPAPPPVTPPPAPTQAQIDWEHKFRTLQGLFNAEVPKLQSQVKTMAAELQAATARMDQVSKQPEKPAQAVDPKDAENFGQDLVDMVHRNVRALLAGDTEKVSTQLAQLTDRLTKVEARLEGTSSTVAVTAEEVFFNRVGQLVPDWEALNTDQAFLAWLAEVDPVYGHPRKVALAAARDALDSTRVAAVFNAFKSTRPKPAKVDPLAAQVSPRQGAAAAPPQPAKTKATYHQQDVQAFYRDMQSGKYRGREQEAAEIEAQINLALAEGRIM